jgi:hypothetical protein
VNVSTLGRGTPVMSLVEDLLSAITTVVAVLVPVLVVLMLAVPALGRDQVHPAAPGRDLTDESGLSGRPSGHERDSEEGRGARGVERHPASSCGSSC